MAVELQDLEATREVKDSDLGVPNGDPETVYIIRPLTRAKHREIERGHTKKVPNRQTRAMQDETDWQAVADAIYDYVLADWRGVTFRGASVPCTFDRKMLLDTARINAICDAAGLNEVKKEAVAERRAASFREPADVV